MLNARSSLIIFAAEHLIFLDARSLPRCSFYWGWLST
jgi:hypothetical protein